MVLAFFPHRISNRRARRARIARARRLSALRRAARPTPAVTSDAAPDAMFEPMEPRVLLSTALMPFDGGNNLIGDAVGLIENYGGDQYLIDNGALVSTPAGAYTAPNGAINPGPMPGPAPDPGADLNQMPGSSASIRTVTPGGASDPFGDGIVGINLAQVATLGAGSNDARLGITNPQTGGSSWLARFGALTTWQTLNENPGGGDPIFLLPLGSVTSQVFNLTPRAIVAASGDLTDPSLDDGLAPGSLSNDGSADFLPFVMRQGSDARVASITLEFFDVNDADAFGGTLPEALTPRVRDFEDPEPATTGNIGGGLDEGFFGHNAGNDLTGSVIPSPGPADGSKISSVTGDEIDDFVDDSLFLGGALENAFLTLTWTEVDADNNPQNGFQASGEFELDVQFFGDVVYDEGSLVDEGRVQAGSAGDLNLQWDDIAFTSFASTAGGADNVNTGGFDSNNVFDYDHRDSPSSSQTFTTSEPQPDIDIEKTTDGPDNLNPTDSDFDNEDDPNGVGVPLFAPGDDITWTYKVTNTGDVAIPEADITVTDSVDGVDPMLVIDANSGDGVLSPGEMWFYQATGTAQDLGMLNLGEQPDGSIIVPGCNPDNIPGQDRHTYNNVGTVMIPGDMDSDPSHYCNPPEPGAKIQIIPDDTNEVGDPHTFTVIVMEDDGLTALEGGDGVDGFTPAVGETVTVTLDGINGAVPDLILPSDELPADPTVVVGVTDANGEFEVTFVSASAGQVIGGAESDVAVGGEVITVATDGLGENSDPATKTFVDAKIIIEEDGVNPVGDPHTFTASVWVDDGLGTDAGDGMGTFDRVGAGEGVRITLSGDGSAVPDLISPMDLAPMDPTVVDGLTDGLGEFSVIFSSATTGIILGHAETMIDVTGPDGTVVTLFRETDGLGNNSDDAVKEFVDRDIDLEKLTNGVDADTEEEAPLIVPGSLVTWTYKVTNTGTAGVYTLPEIEIVDDAGTPGDTGDDFSIATGDIVFDPTSDVGNDGFLSPGEMWIFEAEGIAEDLPGGGPVGDQIVFNMSGSSGLDGPDGNIRTFNAGGVSVNASAFSRTDGGTWNEAFLGAFSGGLGVTDSGEGSGGSNMHTVDNVGRDNYVLFEISETVVVDSAFLGFVVDDSDLTIWIGTVEDAFNNHQTLSDAFLAGLGLTELNLTGSSSARTADFNAGNIAGNVLVIAARTEGGDSDEDRFKLEKLKLHQTEGGCYENYAVLYVNDNPEDEDPSHYCNAEEDPGIDLEKFTNGVNADDEADAPVIAPGDLVTWTYKITNTGNTNYTLAEVEIVDDAGTPGNPGDDFSTASGDIVLDASSDDGSDGILSPGEMWIYEASDVAENLPDGGTGDLVTIFTTGSTFLDGPDGNIRTYGAGGISVHASAFSRTSGGTWNEGYLGAYSSGLGVTDTGEGDGTNGKHRVDNYMRDNYVLFEFSETVVVDQAFLDSVVSDSDITVWIGTVPDAFNNHITLNDGVLAALDLNEDNAGGSSDRFADFNNGEVAGNVLVIAASTSDKYRYDKFKIRKLKVWETEAACYENHASVTAPGASDSDLSHYCNPDDAPPPPDRPMVMFEAEDYNRIKWPWKVVSDSDASGGKFIKTHNGAGSYYHSPPSYKYVKYDFNIPMSGKYDMSALVNAPNHYDNSFWVQVDGGEWIEWHLDVTGDSWQWQDVTDGWDKSDVGFHLSVGTHWLKIKVREDGTMLDKIKFTKRAPSGPVMFEAENYEWADWPWKVMHDSGASGGKYTMVPEGMGNYYNSAPWYKEMKYTFSLDHSGQFKLDALVKAPHGGSNSVWVQIDNGGWIEWHINETGDNWSWETATHGSGQSDVTFNLGAGNHMLRIKLREDGTMLDKFMISDA